MASNLKGIAIVIMGVSGAGKSMIGELLAKDLKCNFLDADDFHPQSNKDRKDAQGYPFFRGRPPSIGLKCYEMHFGGKTVILGCSTLRKCYRETLRSADPNYEFGSYDECSVKFMLLNVEADVLVSRLQKRAAEGKHFTPANLMQSQLDLLETDESEGIYKLL